MEEISIGGVYVSRLTGNVCTLETTGPGRVAVKFLLNDHYYAPYNKRDEENCPDCKAGLVGFGMRHFQKNYKLLKK